MNILRDKLVMLSLRTGDTMLFPQRPEYTPDLYDHFAANLRNKDNATLRPIDPVNVAKRRRKR